jgi:hypothetical protein
MKRMNRRERILRKQSKSTQISQVRDRVRDKVRDRVRDKVRDRVSDRLGLILY